MEKEKKEKGGKLEEKKEHMAKKMFVSGHGSKSHILKGLKEMEKNPKLEKHSIYNGKEGEFDEVKRGNFK